MPFVTLHYTDEAGRPAKLRATQEHLVFLAGSELALAANSAEVPPGGRASRTDKVEVGFPTGHSLLKTRTHSSKVVLSKAVQR